MLLRTFPRTDEWRAKVSRKIRDKVVAVVAQILANSPSSFLLHQHIMLPSPALSCPALVITYQSSQRITYINTIPSLSLSVGRARLPAGGDRGHTELQQDLLGAPTEVTQTGDDGYLSPTLYIYPPPSPLTTTPFSVHRLRSPRQVTMDTYHLPSISIHILLLLLLLHSLPPPSRCTDCGHRDVMGR